MDIFSAEECYTVKDWINLILSRREEVLERCGSPGLNPIPLGQYPLVQQSSLESNQTPVVRPKKVDLFSMKKTLATASEC